MGVSTAFVLALAVALPIMGFGRADEGTVFVVIAVVITLAMLPLVGFLLFYVVSAFQAVLMRGPVITIGPDGFCDRRVSSDTVPWDRLRWYRQTRSTVSIPASSPGPYRLDVIAYDVEGPYAVTPHYRMFSWYLRVVRNPPWRVIPFLKVRTDQLAEAMRVYSRPIDPTKR